MIITAKYSSICPSCNARIEVGARVEWSKGSKARHVSCPTSATATNNRRPRMGSGHGSAASVRGYSSYCTDNASCRCYDCSS